MSARCNVIQVFIIRKFMKSESENLCSKLTEKTSLLIKKVYDSKLLEKLMNGCG